ncbi:hypothetical protein Nmel_014181 [Mimus melanotis]
MDSLCVATSKEFLAQLPAASVKELFCLQSRNLHTKKNVSSVTAANGWGGAELGPFFSWPGRQSQREQLEERDVAARRGELCGGGGGAPGRARIISGRTFPKGAEPPVGWERGQGCRARSQFWFRPQRGASPKVSRARGCPGPPLAPGAVGIEPGPASPHSPAPLGPVTCAGTVAGTQGRATRL